MSGDVVVALGVRGEKYQGAIAEGRKCLVGSAVPLFSIAEVGKMNVGVRAERATLSPHAGTFRFY